MVGRRKQGNRPEYGEIVPFKVQNYHNCQICQFRQTRHINYCLGTPDALGSFQMGTKTVKS